MSNMKLNFKCNFCNDIVYYKDIISNNFISKLRFCICNYIGCTYKKYEDNSIYYRVYFCYDQNSFSQKQVIKIYSYSNSIQYIKNGIEYNSGFNMKFKNNLIEVDKLIKHLEKKMVLL